MWLSILFSLLLLSPPICIDAKLHLTKTRVKRQQYKCDGGPCGVNGSKCQSAKYQCVKNTCCTYTSPSVPYGGTRYPYSGFGGNRYPMTGGTPYTGGYGSYGGGGGYGSYPFTSGMSSLGSYGSYGSSVYPYGSANTFQTIDYSSLGGLGLGSYGGLGGSTISGLGSTLTGLGSSLSGLGTGLGISGLSGLGSYGLGGFGRRRKRMIRMREQMAQCPDDSKPTGVCKNSNDCDVEKEACTNGKCCKRTHDWQSHCGGDSAAAACVDGECGQGFTCIKGFCCSCPTGIRPIGPCIRGNCPLPGATCQPFANVCCLASNTETEPQPMGKIEPPDPIDKEETNSNSYKFRVLGNVAFISEKTEGDVDFKVSGTIVHKNEEEGFDYYNNHY